LTTRLKIRVSAVRFRDLYDTLQITFGWSDDHLHCFIIHGRQYGIAYLGGIDIRDDPRRIKLSDLGLRVKEKFFSARKSTRQRFAITLWQWLRNWRVN
jgi:hypothetical protein